MAFTTSGLLAACLIGIPLFCFWLLVPALIWSRELRNRKLSETQRIHQGQSLLDPHTRSNQVFRNLDRLISIAVLFSDFVQLSSFAFVKDLWSDNSPKSVLDSLSFFFTETTYWAFFWIQASFVSVWMLFLLISYFAFLHNSFVRAFFKQRGWTVLMSPVAFITSNISMIVLELLFFPFIRNCFAAVACTYSEYSITLDVDPGMQCWQDGMHIAASVFVTLALPAFFVIAMYNIIVVRPTKGRYIRSLEDFDTGFMMAKTLLCALTTFFSRYIWGSIICLFSILVFLLCYQVIRMPILGRVGRFANSVRVASFAGALCSAIWAFVAKAINDKENHIPVIGYFVTVGPVLIGAYLLNAVRAEEFKRKRQADEPQDLLYYLDSLPSETCPICSGKAGAVLRFLCAAAARHERAKEHLDDYSSSEFDLSIFWAALRRLKVCGNPHKQADLDDFEKLHRLRAAIQTAIFQAVPQYETRVNHDVEKLLRKTRGVERHAMRSTFLLVGTEGSGRRSLKDQIQRLYGKPSKRQEMADSREIRDHVAGCIADIIHLAKLQGDPLADELEKYQAAKLFVSTTSFDGKGE